MSPLDRTREWLETDGLGGYASGTVARVRTRRYHGLLLAAMRPPGERFLLVNGVEAWIESEGLRLPLSAQHYSPGVTTGAERAIESFTHEPWPRWTFALPGGVRVTHELAMRHGLPLIALRWRVDGAPANATLCVRPLLSGRDPHELHHANRLFVPDASESSGRVRWEPYAGVPATLALASGTYEHAPDWYWRFEYDIEIERGLDAHEDLMSPGVFRHDLANPEAVIVFAAETPVTRHALMGAEPGPFVRDLFESERARRASFATPLERAADAYLVQRGRGLTVIAGYPWFGDWGRDTFIALRGLCLATGRLDEARRILIEWSGAVSQGMLPNRFADLGDRPEFNAVDASLWFVVVVGEWLDAMRAAARPVAPADLQRLRAAAHAILTGYTRGTRHAIAMDPHDGLLRCGEPGVQLTWMDAKAGDWVVTPRIGKPVEVQALWIHALAVGARFEPSWAEAHARARDAFEPRFWNEQAGYLNDIVDVDHVRGSVDASLRPNQLFAIGGLPGSLVSAAHARQVLDACERALVTPLGPRTLSPDDPAYVAHYLGDRVQRDGGYHQGTAWPWLNGAFVEAWLRVHGDEPGARAEADRRFVAPLRAHLAEAGLGHVSEIVDGDPPHTPRGCPFQAWSVSELLRVERLLGKR